MATPPLGNQTFYERVFDLVRQVPRGRVTTYGNVAAAAGSPRAARQVGYAMARCKEDADVMPWHRVINASGMISGRGDWIRVEEQRQRLEAEGIAFNDAGQVDLARLRWTFILDGDETGP